MDDIVYEQEKTQKLVGSVQNNIEQLQLLMAHPQGIQPRIRSLSDKAEALEPVPAPLGSCQPLNKAPSKDLGPFIRVPATVQQVCRKSCMCRCHNKTTLKSPGWVQNLVGALFIGTWVSHIISHLLIVRIE